MYFTREKKRGRPFGTWRRAVHGGGGGEEVTEDDRKDLA